MNGPRRLNQSGGYTELLLRSASIDRPSEEARRRAVNLASTESSFSTTTTPSRAKVRPIGTAKTLAKWISIGAAAGSILALGGAQLLDSAGEPHSAANNTEALPELPATTGAAPLPPRDISPEPAFGVAPPSSRATGSASPPAPSDSIRPWAGGPPPVKTPGAREIDAARAAVSRGDDAAAIAKLNEYEQAHPNGALAPEAMALRIQALAHSGKTGDAKTLAGEFENKYPGHPLCAQIKNSIATSGGPSTPK